MNYLIPIVILFLSLNNKPQELRCEKFKTGKFKYTNSKYSGWIVTRTDSTQTETILKEGIEIHSTIEWQNNCEYILTYTKTKNFDIKEIIGKSIEITIIKTTLDAYTYRSKNDFRELELTKL